MDNLSNPEPILEIVIGTLGVVLVIFVHGAGIRSISRRFNRSWIRVERNGFWRPNLLLGLTIGSLAGLHFLETLIWAVPISHGELIHSMRDSYYFVLESYTTLGAGNISLPDQWRLLGPSIAMSGLFTFGWTGSVLVSIMTEFGKLDRKRARSLDSRATDGPPESGTN
ncbi:ion channel [Mesorhizobium sp. L-8-3]|uniref:ion channel n=1 Tax=Mesorhizobium sp. L-8-3 TaxID=2744522 RepID=UPI00192845BA|nr:ion channel [Mesorhizobium sp. L-8-3]BCH27493.1 hypothetical protein MesoLjLb_72780 [Mesorhizobium sp. L-8-3]